MSKDPVQMKDVIEEVLHLCQSGGGRKDRAYLQKGHAAGTAVRLKVLSEAVSFRAKCQSTDSCSACNAKASLQASS